MCCFSPISSLFQEMTWSFYHYCCTSDLRGGSTAEGCTGRARGTSWIVWACFPPKLPLPKCYASAWGCVKCVKIDVMLFFLLTQQGWICLVMLSQCTHLNRWNFNRNTEAVILKIRPVGQTGLKVFYFTLRINGFLLQILKFIYTRFNSPAYILYMYTYASV